LNGIQEVSGSIPLISTTYIKASEVFETPEAGKKQKVMQL